MERPRWRDVSMWRNPQLPPPNPAKPEVLPHPLGFIPNFSEIHNNNKALAALVAINQGKEPNKTNKTK